MHPVDNMASMTYLDGMFLLLLYAIFTLQVLISRLAVYYDKHFAPVMQLLSIKYEMCAYLLVYACRRAYVQTYMPAGPL